MRRSAAGILALLCASASVARAQGHAMHTEPAADPHMRMTPDWPAQPGDAARADSILAVARSVAGKYRDVARAEQDGYHRFAADVPHQRVYHYSKLTAVVKARLVFDPASPSSLLYQDDGTGGMTLIGVMYTAPAGATLEQLNDRIPLSVARWHLHSNICLPPAGQGRDSLATPGARFGFRGTITTRTACDAAGGRFRDEMFGWMLHLNLFEPGNPWQDDHRGMRPS